MKLPSGNEMALVRREILLRNMKCAYAHKKPKSKARFLDFARNDKLCNATWHLKKIICNAT